MEDTAAGRPDATEFDPYYAGYVARVVGDDPVGALGSQLEKMVPFLRGLEPGLAGHRYAEGKWAVSEVIGHLADSERIFGTRALRIARGDRTPQPGFDQDAYVAEGGFVARSPGDLAEELGALRRANLALFRSLDREDWRRIGVANGAPVSVRAIAFILVGHAAHHLDVLRERYLPKG
jgi:hypothetical protein